MRVSVVLSVDVDPVEWASQRKWGSYTTKAVRESVRWAILNNTRVEPGVMSARLGSGRQSRIGPG